MKLTIHRGTREIGGNCIEIQSRGRRIFFDLGITLVDPGGGRFGLGGGNGTSGRELLDTGTLPRISGVYQWDALDESVEGIVLSHAHLDHYGFACHLHEGIRRYMGEGTRRLIEITGLLSGAGLLTTCCPCLTEKSCQYNLSRVRTGDATGEAQVGNFIIP
ncbi:MAG TPA: MBL fold metallo-hydrolase [Syntrophorhabdus sp.]|jgi:ribonuclease J|nr:MBL fold metallo-hydrolase [Deltaproteobacteria bacterium]HQO63262.1 MBL fold metallo-hydrolase [Syntrophorhabdus sp.]